jgi:2-methylcitrate dehydratase PrpD
MALAEKVRVAHDPEITALGAGSRHKVRVQVFLGDGTRLEETVEAPRGSERSFASEDEVVAKFRKLAAYRIERSHADRIADLVLHAERLADAAELVRALRT